MAAEWTIERPRIFDILSPAKNILIAGCGGGYDILSGLPLYFNLRAQGKTVILANLSFTNLESKNLPSPCKGCYTVSNLTKLPSGQGRGIYFPEYYLACWLKEVTGQDAKVYAFDRDNGCKQLSTIYKHLVKEHEIEAVVLVDGGTDSLTFGSEEMMGTPTEDHSSMVAANDSGASIRLLVCLGFGVDSFHGISHGLFLENVATMEKAGGYYGCFSVSRHSKEGKLLMEGYKSVSSNMEPSIVCASITDAMKGEFGDHHSTERTRSSILFINTLMTIYWVFDLSTAVQQIPYREEILRTVSSTEIYLLIARHQEKVKQMGHTRKSIPLPM